VDRNTILAIIGAIIGFFAAAFAGWQAYETRRQRLSAPPASTPKPPIIIPQPATASWTCGIYDYRPLSAFPPGPNAKPSGILVDLAAEVMRKLGLQCQFTFFNYGGFYENEDRIPDLIVGMFETRRRAAKVKFSRPIYEVGLQGICRVAEQGDILERMRDGDLRIVVYAGEVGWEFAMDELPDAVEQQRVAILGGGHPRDTMSLLTRDYDVVLMDELSCTNLLREGESRRQFKLAFDHPPQTFDSCMAVKLCHSSYLKEIDAEIGRIRNTPWYLEREALALKGFEDVVDRRGLKRQ
jgi:ABC-type amino acid transport substrate-binding protein